MKTGAPQRGSKWLSYLLGGFLAAAAIAAYIWYVSRHDPVLEIWVFDEPGAPALFIRTPDDYRFLVDGGANADIVRHITAILPFYSRHIDGIFVTDEDGTHVTGLIDVIGRYSVDAVYVPALSLESLGISTTSDIIYQTLLKTTEEGGLHRLPLSAGETVSLGSRFLSLGKETSLDVLFPVATSSGSLPPMASTTSSSFGYTKASAPNLEFRVRYGSTTVEYMGGITTKVQKLLAMNGEAKDDILISSMSSTPSNYASELMDSRRPDYLIYSEAIHAKPTVKKNDTKNTPKKQQKQKPDPLASILSDRRFNVRRSGEIKIATDGATVTVSD